MKMFRRGEKGFTLVEIAIVLVIVGLVLFGVLKGTEMVKSGKVKKSSKQIEQLQASIYAYVDKYRGKFPGENGGANATSLGVFQDMSTAGLIAYDATTGMANGYGGPVTAALATGVITITSANVPDYAARLIDLAFDDGTGTTGNIIISGGATAYASTDTVEDQTDRTLEVTVRK